MFKRSDFIFKILELLEFFKCWNKRGKRNFFCFVPIWMFKCGNLCFSTSMLLLVWVMFLFPIKNWNCVRPSSVRTTETSRLRRLKPILRAYPSSEVTEPFCRLLWPIFVLKVAQAAFAGKLEAHQTPRRTRCFHSWVTQSPGRLISAKKLVKKKRQRFPKQPPALPNTCTLPYVLHVSKNAIPFQNTRQSLRARNIPVFQDRLNHLIPSGVILQG